MNFKEQLKIYQDYINLKLDSYFKNDNTYEKNLRMSMRYSLLAGGKRIRPILMMATYRLFKEDFEKCDSFAIGMEMVHNASLIHDDMPCIDNDDFRHGKPTNHKMYDECTALLAGDALFNYSNVVILEDISKEKDSLNVKNKIKALKEFVIAKDRMIAGEYYDTISENKKLNLEELEYMHKNKTGELIKESVRIGAILAGADENKLNELTGYAEKIGLAFQIKDDILSEIGDSKITGKPVGNDKQKNKANYISIFGLEKSEEMLKEVIDDAISHLDMFKGKEEFLRDLAIYIRDREK